ncbi:hypothetical protein NQ318_009881 [Aromia moschata]|uniref:Uncharacterized protein n=1 Tax=Aromia moschata TaxID=1265417 RepID=A0AAV8Y226_9CUCU|nr:hypothetical protein NQ318_009881 [Aromia moschata]
MGKQTVGWAICALLVSTCIMDTLSAGPQGAAPREERKYAEKSNSIKKVDLDNLDDVETNQISESGGGGGFTWSNLLGMIMQMIFNPAANQGPNKSEGLDDGPIATTSSPWANLISVGLKILTAILGGGAATNDGIDKVDNGGSPMQGVLAAVLGAMVGGNNPGQVHMMAKQASEFISIIVNLLEALKTSFSHRSLAARNIGRKDTVSDAALAGIAMMKGYVRSLNTEDSKCLQKYMCEANNECSTDIGSSSLYCHLGTYAASFVLDRTTSSSTFDVLYEAGRRGRSGDNCQQAYLECNEV